MIAGAGLAFCLWVGCTSENTEDDTSYELTEQKEPYPSMDTAALPYASHKHVFSLYKRSGKVMHVAKAYKINKDSFKLCQFHVDISPSATNRQTFTSAQRLSIRQLENCRKKLQGDYTWVPLSGEEVLFVQIQPQSSEHELDLLDLRQEVEDQLDEALKSKNLGEWFAGDLGPGGANMLYHVKDADKAMQVILQVLAQHHIQDQVHIGRRVLIAEGDWFYEIIYPAQYSGVFETM